MEWISNHSNWLLLLALPLVWKFVKIRVAKAIMEELAVVVHAAYKTGDPPTVKWVHDTLEFIGQEIPENVAQSARLDKMADRIIQMIPKLSPFKPYVIDFLATVLKAVDDSVNELKTETPQNQ